MTTSSLALFGGTALRGRSFPPWPAQGPKDLAALTRVLEAGSWGGDPEPNTEGSQFAKAFARRHDSEFGICCQTGTEANRISMKAAGLRPGDEVLVVGYNWVSPITSVTAAGGIPVVLDVDPDTHLMDLTLLEAALSPRTRGIMSMHYTGRVVPPEPILDFCKKHDLFYVEDCAQAHGGAWKGQAVGSFGDAAAWSFQTSKILTSGEGGAITTNSAEVADAAHAMVDNNRQKPWFTREIRFPEVTNSRMTEFQAALLGSQLELLDERHERRLQNARVLHKAVREIPGISSLEPVADETSPAYWKFVLLLGEDLAGISKSVFMKALEAEGVPVEPGHVPANIHPSTEPCRDDWVLVSRDDGRNAESLPVSEHLAEHVHVWLPHRILLGEQSDIAQIASAIEKVSTKLAGEDRGRANELAQTLPSAWYESAEL